MSTSPNHRDPVAACAFAAYEVLAMGLGLGLLALICLAWLPVALPLSVLLPQAFGRRLGRRVISLAFRGYLCFLQTFCSVRLDATELEGLRHDEALIIVANHPSLLDAVILLSYFPNMVCVMKAALANNLLFGAGARLARYICNDMPLELVLRAREELEAGGQLLLFPEGTRTTRFPVNPCSGSTGLISARTGVPVQTVLIEFSTPYLGKQWPLFRPPVLPLHITIRLGRRFAPPQDVLAFTEELERYFHDALAVPSAAAPIANNSASTEAGICPAAQGGRK